jgi:hypothetical protein
MRPFKLRICSIAVHSLNTNTETADSLGHDWAWGIEFEARVGLGTLMKEVGSGNIPSSFVYEVLNSAVPVGRVVNSGSAVCEGASSGICASCANCTATAIHLTSVFAGTG